MSSFSINRTVLVGRLTKDPELHELPAGSSVCNLRIACNSSHRDAEGDFQDKPNFFDVSVYGAQAEHVDRSIHKGDRVAIDGRLDWREWETSDEQKRQAVSIVADTVMFLDSPGERAGLQRGDEAPAGAIDQDTAPAGTIDLGTHLRPARELIGVGADAEGDELIF